jgi:anti-sigma factor RsiW
MMRPRMSARHDMVCQQAVELVTDYLEGALRRSDRRRFEWHLARCSHCVEYLAQIRATIAITGRVTPDDLTDQMRTEFIALYRRWQHDRHTGDAD